MLAEHAVHRALHAPGALDLPDGPHEEAPIDELEVDLVADLHAHEPQEILGQDERGRVARGGDSTANHGLHDTRIAYEDADVIACAATYAFHLTQAHAFVDGNKRVGAAAMLVCLVANEVELRATEDELYDLFISIASSRTTRSQLQEWLRARVR